MNLTIVYSITEYLARAVTVAYRKAKKDVAKSNRKNIAGFSDKLPSYLSIDFNDTDKKLLRNFEQECFTVACVGSYELEEKLKQAAVEILNKPESVTGNRFEAFVKEARDLMDGYLPPKDGKAPQTGWLKTNFQTAVSSAYNASQWQMLHDPAIAGLYPAYQYKTREDARVRDEHRALNNSVYYAHDDIWKSIYPPNGWNCRCYIKYLSQDEIRQPGNEPIDLNPAMRTELIKQAKIHPDFNRNSGITGHIFDKWIKSKLKDIPEKIRLEISKLAENYAALQEDGTYIIGDADPDLREMIKPSRIYDKDIYSSLEIKPFEYYFRDGMESYSYDNLIFFGFKRFKDSKFIESFVHNHELMHVFATQKGIITDTKVDARIVESYKKAQMIFEQNKQELLEFFDFKNRQSKIAELQKANQKYTADETQFLLACSADFVASLTKGVHGWGHQKSYWNRPNSEFKEFFNRAAELGRGKNFIMSQYMHRFAEVAESINQIIMEHTNAK